MSEKKSVLGLPENIIAALSYAGLFVSGVFVLIFEKENKFVRFHALQSTILFAAIWILNWMLGILKIIPLFGGFVLTIFNFFTMVIYIYLIFMAFKGITFKVPILGDIVWEQVSK